MYREGCNGRCACTPQGADDCGGHGNAVLAAVFDSVHVHIAVMDRDFTLLRVNKAYCRADGRPEEALLGRNHFELYPDEENERLFRTVVNTGKSYSATAKPFVYAHQPERGVTYWDWTLSPIHDAAGGVEGLILTLADVTEQERRRIEAERIREALEQRVSERTSDLESAVRELESFSYCVSHDLSTPLRAINGYATLLEEEFAPQLPGEAMGYIGRIREASARIDQLMAGLLQLNQVSRSELSRSTVDMSSLAAHIIEDLRREQPGRNVNFICGENISAYMDQDMAGILLANLLGNAWKFTSHAVQAEIRFACVDGGAETIYSVSDNGAGFDMASADKLYGLFQRLHGSHEYPGSGIGLATVARIIRSHGGRIWAQAREGEGATFFFTLGGA